MLSQVNRVSGRETVFQAVHGGKCPALMPDVWNGQQADFGWSWYATCLGLLLRGRNTTNR